MTPPPTLNYAAPWPPPRNLMAAFVLLLVLASALLTCLGFAVFSGQDAAPIACCACAVPFALLAILAQLLFALRSDFKESP